MCIYLLRPRSLIIYWLFSPCAFLTTVRARCTYNTFWRSIVYQMNDVTTAKQMHACGGSIYSISTWFTFRLQLTANQKIIASHHNICIYFCKKHAQANTVVNALGCFSKCSSTFVVCLYFQSLQKFRALVTALVHLEHPQFYWSHDYVNYCFGTIFLLFRFLFLVCFVLEIHCSSLCYFVPREAIVPFILTFVRNEEWNSVREV